MAQTAAQREVVILRGARPVFGAFGGALRDVTALDLGVVATKGALAREPRREINEAFAAQYRAVERDLGLARDRTNVNGGAARGATASRRAASGAVRASR